MPDRHRAEALGRLACDLSRPPQLPAGRIVRGSPTARHGSLSIGALRTGGVRRCWAGDIGLGALASAAAMEAAAGAMPSLPGARRWWQGSVDFGAATAPRPVAYNFPFTGAKSRAEERARRTASSLSHSPPRRRRTSGELPGLRPKSRTRPSSKE